MKARIYGVIAIALGLGVAWFFGIHQLDLARAGAEQVTISQKAFMVTPMMLMMGLMLLVGGTPVLHSFAGPPRTARDHLFVWPILIVSFVGGFFAWQWMDGQLHQLGYLTNGI